MVLRLLFVRDVRAAVVLNGLVLSIYLIHCGNEFRNSVPVRALGLAFGSLGLVGVV